MWSAQLGFVSLSKVLIVPQLFPGMCNVCGQFLFESIGF